MYYEHQKLRKKIRKFSLKTAEDKKKNKKQAGAELGKNVENTSSEHQKLRKKIRKFSLKTAEAKKKNKKKTGSNVEKLRKLEPQQKQRVLIKKNECNYG